MHIILCHENADFDAVAALLGAHKLYPDAIPMLPERLNANVARFLALYRSGLPFVARDEQQQRRRIEKVTLVDTNRVPAIKGIKPNTPIHIIDHHPLTRELEPNETFEGEVIGSTTTLLIERMQAEGIDISSLEATLLALGIYEDTGSLVYRQTTARDIMAAAWLVEHGAVLDNVRRFLEPPLTDEQQELLETLVTTAENRTIQGYSVLVAAAKLDRYMAELSSVAHRLRDTLDPAALFLLVEMPKVTQLVCRSTDDAIDVGEIARAFGGGGHERAAAATIRDMTREEALDRLWEQIYLHVQPAVSVGDLMSRGAQTVQASAKVGDVIGKMRRIGHEGFPVVEDGKIVGLLTRRDADRAAEHNLRDLEVREIMSSGSVTLKPTDSVTLLEQKMVESGWGQIPVVADSGKLIGIVTRTDLIKHWARSHPTGRMDSVDRVTIEQIADVLGEPVARLIKCIAEQAQERNVNLYMVGGVVRDLLLKRRNFDIDFVVEGDAIAFARSLIDLYGGAITHFRPFGTAKWRLREGEFDAEALGDPALLPDHVDFASARNEFYEHPTALPTVYSGSIKLDLQRRDFTINTLAVQLSPTAGRILDFYGGLADLHAGRIRVLHSLSFVDDPTRVLRAARFERRLGFTIEPRTQELIQIAMPMLRRITGERLRNELTLLLKERDPELSFLLLQQRGILKAIHPAFVLNERIVPDFQRARTAEPPPTLTPPDLTDLLWHVMLCDLPPKNLSDLLDRLVFSRPMTKTMIEAGALVGNAAALADPALTPSRIAVNLDGASEVALLTAWLVITDRLARERIWEYVSQWRHMRPLTDGHALRERGLEPGPAYSTILSRLRAARLDGEVTNDEEEKRLLLELINGVPDDRVG